MRIVAALALAAATFLAASSVASSAAAPGAPQRTAGEYLRSGHFKVLLDGVPIAVQKIEGMDETGQVLDRSVRKQRQTKSGTLTLVTDAESSKALFAWQKSVLDGRGEERKSVSIVFMNDDGSEASRIILHNCLPVKVSGPSLNAKSSGHATERITIAWETMEIK